VINSFSSLAKFFSLAMRKLPFIDLLGDTPCFARREIFRDFLIKVIRFASASFYMMRVKAKVGCHRGHCVLHRLRIHFPFFARFGLVLAPSRLHQPEWHDDPLFLTYQSEVHEDEIHDGNHGEHTDLDNRGRRAVSCPHAITDENYGSKYKDEANIPRQQTMVLGSVYSHFFSSMEIDVIPLGNQI
jgi:hypothetical protein